MKEVPDGGERRCRVCREAVIPDWQLVCEECWQRHQQELEEEADRRHWEHLVHLDDLRERIRQRRGGEERC